MRQRKKRIASQCALGGEIDKVDLNDSAFPCSWYPLCRAADLKKGQVIRQQAFGVPFAIFRTAQNQVGALQATCGHMGADLAKGQVVGERLRCPLHHWAYSLGGQCEHIPNYSQIPRGARQLALPCEEHYGLIFGFLGGEPTFPFPHFGLTPQSLFETENGKASSEALYSPASRTDFAAPYQVLVANSFDGQHFATVHDRELLAPASLTTWTPAHLCIRYEARVVGQRLNDRLMRAAGIKTVAIEIHCWGGNTLLVYNQQTASTILVALLPVTAQQSRIFITTVLAKRRKHWLGRLSQHFMLGIAHQLTLAFLRPDMAVLENLTLRPRLLLPDADACFIQWLRYWKALPRTSVAG